MTGIVIDFFVKTGSALMSSDALPDAGGRLEGVSLLAESAGGVALTAAGPARMQDLSQPPLLRRHPSQY